MENCLKTQLKESVSNDNLQRLGMLRLNVKVGVLENDQQRQLLLRVSEPCKGICRNGVAYLATVKLQDPYQQEINIQQGSSMVYLKNQDFCFDISNKMAINGFSTENQSLFTSLIEFNLEDFKYVLNLDVLILKNSNVKGTINSLGLLILLNVLNLLNTTCPGEITTLAADMVTNGRTSGKLTVVGNGVITLDNTIVANGTEKYVKFGTSLPSGAEATGTGWAVYATDPDA